MEQKTWANMASKKRKAVDEVHLDDLLLALLVAERIRVRHLLTIGARACESGQEAVRGQQRSKRE